VLVFDLESDGLLDTISKVHCINLIDRSDGREYRFTDHEFYQNLDGSYSEKRTPRDGTIADALNLLSEAEALGGQNIVRYDLPALAKVYEGFARNPDATIRDTKIMSQVMYPTLFDKDFAMSRKGKLPSDFIKRGHAGSHSLGAWGLRLGKTQKADFKPKDYGHTWATMPFTEEMDEYCMIDVRTNVDILEHFEKRATVLTTDEALDLEMRVAEIIQRQEQFGWSFDVEGAEALTHELQGKKAGLEDELRATFQPFFVRQQAKLFRPAATQRRWVRHPKGAHTRIIKEETGETYLHTFKNGRTQKRKVYREVKQRGWWEYLDEGASICKVKMTLFNPASRDHIANRLSVLFGWEPIEYTDSGKPKVDEDTLKSLEYPEAQKIIEYLMVDKRLGQVADGKQAWLKRVKPDGRVHTKVNPLGTITTRMTHYDFNIAQVPSSKKPYGSQCRALFYAPDGYLQVGCDAEGLELRMLGHFMAKWDGGEYVQAVTTGNKEDGTDAHTLNMIALKFNSRENAKTWFYAFIYGAGMFKLGTIVLEDFDEDTRRRFYEKYPAGRARDQAISRLGSRSRARIAEGIPALGKFIEAVKAKAKRGYVKGLDGRRIYTRSDHSAPNTLLQGDGAITMKKALVLLDDNLQQQGLKPGKDYEFNANIHDEFQIESAEEHAETVGQAAAEAIRLAGEHFSLRCPLAGAYATGRSWADTH
tara:strand:- start:11440 stop:13548 length:2109 start_codon:yes stop_codon:yes gene_type:complete